MVDEALEHTCGEFRARAVRGEISEAERDLLIDGAILLAVNFEELIQDVRAGYSPSWPDFGRHRLGRVRGRVSPAADTNADRFRAHRAARTTSDAI